MVKYQHCIFISKEVIAFLKCYRFFGHPAVDNIALKETVTGVWGIFWGAIFRKLSQLFSYLCNKIPTPQSQLLHFTKYIYIHYLQQMHKLIYFKFWTVMTLFHILRLLSNNILYVAWSCILHILMQDSSLHACAKFH